MMIIVGAAASYGEISSPVWIWFVPIGRLLLEVLRVCLVAVECAQEP
jgi:hypothetical protein